MKFLSLLGTFFLCLVAYAGNDDISIRQCYQTTGRGNKAPMLMLDVRQDSAGALLRSVEIVLKGNTRSLISNVALFSSEGPEPLADRHFPLRVNLKLKSDTVRFKLARRLEAGHNYFLITARVKNDAALLDSIDLCIPRLNIAGKDIALGRNGDPDGAAMIFAVQEHIFVPTKDSCRFYRIPAMISAADGSIVAIADRRYDSDRDLGHHKIDLAVRRSTDGGRSWSKQRIIACGDTTIEERYGFGDAALVMARSKKLICLMACGSRNFTEGGLHIAMSTSTDNGKTWTEPEIISGADRLRDEVTGRNGLGVKCAFVSSGKGLTLPTGRLLFLVDCMPNELNTATQTNYVLYSDDEGEHWTLSRNIAYPPTANEAKLERLPGGAVIASVRRRGYRGFNMSRDGGLTWGKPWESKELYGADCNADILQFTPSTFVHTLLNSLERRNLKLYTSRDACHTWHEALTIQPGSAGYSTMTALRDRSLAILYEDGSYDAGNGYAINFVTLPMDFVESR